MHHARDKGAMYAFLLIWAEFPVESADSKDSPLHVHSMGGCCDQCHGPQGRGSVPNGLCMEADALPFFFFMQEAETSRPKKKKKDFTTARWYCIPRQ